MDITVPYGVDWDEFYGAVFQPVRSIGATQSRLLTSDSARSSVGNFAALQEQFGVLRSGTSDIYEMANPAQTAATGSQVQSGSDPIAELASWIPRLAIIILGFIFVAVGLSLFKVPVAVAVREGFVNGVKQGVSES